MLDILTIVSPIYLIVLVGFALTRMGIFAKPDLRVLGSFVINIALPALLFRSLSQRRIGDILNPTYLGAYLGGSLLVIGIGYLWGRRVSRKPAVTSTFYAMGMSCSNSAFIGYPILLLTLPTIAGVAVALNMIVENLFVIPLLLLMAEHGRGGEGQWRVIGQSFVRLAKTPLIIGLVAGLLVSVLGWQLPAAFTQTVNMFANASGALSLFVIGGTLVGLPLQGMGRQVSPIVVGKLVLHPLLVLLLLAALPYLGFPAIEPPLHMAAVLMAAMPMMSIYPTLAQAYRQEDFSSAALLVATTASFFTLSTLLWVFRHFAVFH